MTSSKGKIAIIGSGRMGRGIAVSFAYQGYSTYLVDVKERTEAEFEDLLSRSNADLASQMNVLVKSNMISADMVDSIMDRIEITHIKNEGEWSESKVLFEAVPEILEVKRVAFEQACEKISADTLILSTTSSFSVNDLAEFVTHKERFMNTHWLNPAYLLPLIEVSPGDDTSKENLKKTFELLEGIGKVP